MSLAGSDFDTLLAVYTGSAVTALTRVAFNDDCAQGGSHSCVTFPVTPGTQYSIQVDGYNGARGVVRVGLTLVGNPAPSNDAFAAAGATFPATGTTVGATPETGEPRASGAAAGASVWWRFTAPPSATSATVRLAVLVVWRCWSCVCKLGCGAGVNRSAVG